MSPLFDYATLAFVTSLVLALGLTPIGIRLAGIFGLVDEPGVRKIHRAPVPRIGGVAIAFASIVSFVVFGGLYISGRQESVPFNTTLTLIVASTCVFLLGLADDIVNIAAKYKLLVLLAVSAMVCASGGVVRQIVIDGKVVLNLGSFAWPLTMLWIVGVTVAINFLDGLDGLAGGIVAIAGGVLALGAAIGGAPVTVLLAMSLVGALLGFLVFNFNPAKVFMGDCGSMFIGFVLAGACVLPAHSIGTTRSLIYPALALSVPLLDTFLTVVRRSVLQRQSIFAAERGHIHHRLLDVGLSPRQAVLVLYLVTLAAAGVGLFGLIGNAWATIFASLGYCSLLCLMFRLAGSVQARQTLTAVRRNNAIRRESRRYQTQFAELQVAFREATTFESWWQHVCKASEALDFAQVSMALARRDGTKYTMRWRRGDVDLVEPDSITAEIPIQQRRSGETLRISVEASGGAFLETAGQRIALFTRLMGESSLAHLPDSGLGRESAAAKGAILHQYADPSHGSDVGELFPNLRVAIVHDFLYTYAGAERVLEQLVALFPHADLFALFDFLPEHLRGFIRNKPVQSTFIQRMPFARGHHRAYLPLMPLAIEQIDISSYDIVISSSYLVAKGILTRPDQLHICYCHTPVRFAWDLQSQYLDSPKSGPLAAAKLSLARVILHYIRNWDIRSSHGVDVFVTNSDFVGRRVRKLYRRVTTTVYPPVDTDRFTLCEEKEDFYLTASRLVPYKRIDLAIEAFRRMPSRRLLVIGEGPELERYRENNPPNVKLLGYQTPDRLRQYMQRARAFVFAAEEDFGITPVEAQACGTPVIAFGRGGVTESVVHGTTGLLFKDQTAAALIDAVEDFEGRQWDSKVIRENAQRFSIGRFREKFAAVTRKEWTQFLVQRVENNRSSMFGLSDDDITRAEIAGQKILAPVAQSERSPSEQSPSDHRHDQEKQTARMSAAELIP
jgi:UDP-N-acetylmuramyl pentapeptide phosphotransferase/UDP-N-acetylglucosamine-1-phosphate transferase/glycosyltransferase involved in cell wall biosynthesis